MSLQEINYYDKMGNPTTYKGNSFTWTQGRKLTSGSMNGKSFTYSYDGNGMRYKKAVNGTTTSYYYNGSQLLMESKNGERIYYIYGVTGIEGMIYDYNTYYSFDKNTLGDIVAIRDSNGQIVAKYDYNAWGEVTVKDANGWENTSASFIGNINPFRYRGYYYDTETGFYYLQTRYYDPTICRFINADNYELVSQLSVGELNMYAYCGNNPIMYTDETGEWLFVALMLIIPTIIGATVGGVVAYNEATEEGKTGSDLFWSTMKGVGIGGSMGLAAGGLSLAATGAISAIFAGTSSIIPMIGLTAKKTVAIGLLAYDLVAMIVAPLIGASMEPIDLGGPSYSSPKPQENPRHPADNRSPLGAAKFFQVG